MRQHKLRHGDLSATTRLLRGKIRYWTWLRTKHWNCFWSWPSISYALPCILADLSLLLFQRFWAIFSSCAVCSFHSTVFGPAFCSCFTNKKQTNRFFKNTNSVLRTTFWPSSKKAHHSFWDFPTKKLNFSPKGSQPEAPLFVVLQDQELMESPVP